MRLVLIMFVLHALLLTACSTGTVQREPVSSGTAEVDYLLKQAREYRQQSQFSQADAILEQALRIDSRSPLTWSSAMATVM